MAAKRSDLGLLLEERSGAVPALTSQGLRWEVEATARLSALDKLSRLHGCSGCSARCRPQASASRAAAGEQGRFPGWAVFGEPTPVREVLAGHNARHKHLGVPARSCDLSVCLSCCHTPALAVQQSLGLARRDHRLQRAESLCRPGSF